MPEDVKATRAGVDRVREELSDLRKVLTELDDLALSAGALATITTDRIPSEYHALINYSVSTCATPAVSAAWAAIYRPILGRLADDPEARTKFVLSLGHYLKSVRNSKDYGPFSKSLRNQSDLLDAIEQAAKGATGGGRQQSESEGFKAIERNLDPLVAAYLESMMGRSIPLRPEASDTLRISFAVIQAGLVELRGLDMTYADVPKPEAKVLSDSLSSTEAWHAMFEPSENKVLPATLREKFPRAFRIQLAPDSETRISVQGLITGREFQLKIVQRPLLWNPKEERYVPGEPCTFELSLRLEIHNIDGVVWRGLVRHEGVPVAELTAFSKRPCHA